MGTKFELYLEEGTTKILEIISSSEIEEEERRFIIEKYAYELSRCIGNTSNLVDYEPLLYGASIEYIDERITTVLSKKNVTNADCENTINLCYRQQKLLGLFQENKWITPRIDNRDIEKCIEELRHRQDSTFICNKIREEDREIEKLKKSGNENLSVEICDKILDLLTALEKDIAYCKSNGIEVPIINNIDISSERKLITEQRKEAKTQQRLSESIGGIDRKIAKIESLLSVTPKQCQEMVDICQTQTINLYGYNQHNWPELSLRYSKPYEIAEKYKHFLSMIEIDNLLVSAKNNLSSKNDYRAYIDCCDAQRNNIAKCKSNGWRIPTNLISDPVQLMNSVIKELNRKERAKTRKRRVIWISVIALFTVVVVLIQIKRYRKGKIQIPFDSSYAVGQNVDQINDELKKAGFTIIVKEMDTNGWLPSGEVTSVLVDNSDSYRKGAYRKPDVNVVIKSSSPGRVYVTDVLKNWKETDYKKVKKKLKEAGLTNINLEEVVTFEKEKDNLPETITLNGESYSNEICYLPKNAPITITYNVLKVGIGSDNSQFVGKDYETVVKTLKESGFTNVNTEEITTGWAKGNSVVGVTVNNVDTYSSSETFDADVKIIVKYSSSDREDVGELLKNWKKTEYTQLFGSLVAEGFINVSLKAIGTDDISKNHLISSIILDGEEYIAGDRYYSKDIPITIEYYSLLITPGEETSSFEDEQYKDVVAKLKKMGFTNIELQRADDIGWWPIHPTEGDVKSISIDGNDDFSEKDSFPYDAPIIIVVHTEEGTGCEDITVVAE